VLPATSVAVTTACGALVRLVSGTDEEAAICRGGSRRRTPTRIAAPHQNRAGSR